MLPNRSVYMTKKKGIEENQISLRANIFSLFCIYCFLIVFFTLYPFYSPRDKLLFYLHKVSSSSPQVLITPSFSTLPLIILIRGGTTLH